MLKIDAAPIRVLTVAPRTAVSLTAAPVQPLEKFEAQSSAAPVPPAPTPVPPFDSKELRRVLGRFPSGVTVVTTGSGEERRGMTASSFTSVSLDPPLVLFCSKNESGTLNAIQANGSFAINVLAQDQAEISSRFAGHNSGNPFDGVAFEAGPKCGLPLLPGALARFECKVHEITQAGDHKIVIGEVVGLDAPTDKAPMAFWGGQLQNLDNWRARS